MKKALRMGTRGSALARAQSGQVAAELTRLTGVPVEVVLVKTDGDQLSSEGKAPPGGDQAGVFVRALDDALREGRCDFAVHSLKDVPTEDAAGLVLAAVPERADVRDALIVASRHNTISLREVPLAEIPWEGNVGTSSPRRVAQLLRLRPDLRCNALAGNVDTRLRKLEEGVADAILLASAGLDRLDRSEVPTRRLDVEVMLPAPGQGALALSCREDDAETRSLLATLDAPEARATAQAERALLAALRGGCRAPVGAHARFVAGRLVLSGRVLSLSGEELVEGESEGTDPTDVGRTLAELLLSRGAAKLIDASRT